MPDDSRFMDRALELARDGWGRVHPNPMVGATIVNGDRIVGEGWHAEYGGPHAEVAALAAAGEAARGATLYVTLEPCAHHGKTPPCTDAILAAGISRVVYGAVDPNPGAAGGGRLLISRGIEVRGGLRGAEAVLMDPAFHWAHRRTTPWVELKLAVSLDGRLSRQAGQPTAVTGPEALAETHRLRAGFDAILVGSRTVHADDPRLTVRGDIEPRVPPVRIVFDSAARTPLSAKMLETIGEAPVWLVSTDAAPPDRVDALRSTGARVLTVQASAGVVDCRCALGALRREGVRSILCEGGGRLAAALLAAKAVGRMHLFVAPDLFGERGVPAFPLVEALDGWTLGSLARLGRDARLVLDYDVGEA
jgi:diaminohydroxyphosphoribosylaminopyrimidine deaminase/5-amino-6-(5-phosphoribosylamino)uracil reductase